MKVLKQFFIYLLWVLLSLILGIIYMRIILGHNDISKEGLWYLLHIFFDFGLLVVGSIIGFIIAILYILLDIFYLKNKLVENKKSLGIRFLIIIMIGTIVVITHYLLEKVIDII